MSVYSAFIVFLAVGYASHLTLAANPLKQIEPSLEPIAQTWRNALAVGCYSIIYNTSGFLSLDCRLFFPPIRVSKKTAIVDVHLNVCGEGKLTFVEVFTRHTCTPGMTATPIPVSFGRASVQRTHIVSMIFGSAVQVLRGANGVSAGAIPAWK